MRTCSRQVPYLWLQEDFMGLAVAETRVVMLFIFFFSSRRRHTRFDCDWSSDVCSSDLVIKGRWNFPGRTYLVLKMILYLTSEFLELESGYKMLMFIFLSLYSKVVVVSGDRKSVV